MLVRKIEEVVHVELRLKLLREYRRVSSDPTGNEISVPAFPNTACRMSGSS
jgi:hypothetical protein